MIRLLATVFLYLVLLGSGSCQNHRFNFTDPDGDCIKMMLELQVEITYNTTDGNPVTVTVPGTNYSSDIVYSCGDRVAMINIVWLDDFSLTVEFGANGMMNQWNLTKLIFEYGDATNSPYFENPLYDDDTMEGTSEAIENIGWDSSYSCGSGITYNLMGMGTAKMTFQYIQVQVFNFTTPGEFSPGPECGSDSDSNTLAIALGAGIGGGVLILVVLIVLLGYCYWSSRRRNEYEPISK